MLLGLALDLSPPLPLTAGVLDKWLAEHTRQIFLPASTFIANAKSYPVLPKGTQSFIREIMKVWSYTKLPVIVSVIGTVYPAATHGYTVRHKYRATQSRWGEGLFPIHQTSREDESRRASDEEIRDRRKFCYWIPGLSAGPTSGR